MAVEEHFCSECRWVKEYITDKDIRLICTRASNPTNYKSAAWMKTRRVLRRLNAPACVDFQERLS